MRAVQIRIVVGESLPEEFPRNAILGVERHNWDAIALAALMILALFFVGRRNRG